MTARDIINKYQGLGMTHDCIEDLRTLLIEAIEKEKIKTLKPNHEDIIHNTALTRVEEVIKEKMG